MKKEIKILRAEYGSDKTPLKIGSTEIPCYVLTDGTRVLSGRGVQKALGANKNVSGTWLRKFINESPVTPFLPPGLLERLNSPLEFVRNNASGSQSKTYGYEATILIDICDAILEANKSRALDVKIVNSAEMIVRSVAKVGIIALVDEATGYQEKREKDELQRFLTKFIKEERGVYIKTYPDEFFQAIFKMRNLTWKEANKGKKPQYIGHYINNYVYSRIAPKVLTELRRANPKDEVTRKRKGKHTQHIDIDFGHPKLKEHLTVLTAFAKAVGYNWNNWQRMVERALPKFDADGSTAPELPLNE
jgi:hypothetical protein